jgi:hypothetical protein
VADQVDVADGLDAHDSEQRAALLVAPERDACADLGVEFVGGHVGVAPAVGGDHAAIRLRGRVDDREDRRVLVVAAGADVARH